MENTIYVKPEDLHSTMLRLRKEKQMDFLRSLTGMDWGTPDEKDAEGTLRGLGVVYHLESTVTQERMVVKTSTLDREHPEVPTVTDIWKGADLPEREAYDFFGIVFVKRVARRPPALFKHLIACGYSQEIPLGRSEVFLPESGEVAHAEAAHVVIFNNERLSVFNRIGEIVRIGKFGCHQFVR